MPGFGAKELPDVELDAVIAYLQHMAERTGAVQGARHGVLDR